jgi:hypothetical protein
MEEKLSELRSTVRAYVRMRNIKRATVMELGQLITPPAGQSGYLHEEEIWREDPVHMTRKGYKLAAAGIESLLYEKRSEEKEAEEKSGQRPTKKPRLDPAINRPSWISGSVSEAVRMDGRGQMGPPPPTTNGEAVHAPLVRENTVVRTSLHAATGSEEDAVRIGAAAQRGDEERLGAAGLPEARADPGESLV